MPSHAPVRVAYIVSRFPKITETFILSEVLELERLGLQIELFPLVHERQEALHPEAAGIMPRVRFASLLSSATVRSQWFWLRNSPGRYLRAWWRALWGNHRSLGFLARAFMIVPLAAHFARDMQRLDVDQVHGAWATHPALAAHVVNILTGIPYSFTIHSHELYIDRTMLEEKIRGARFYTTISDYNRQMIESIYGPAAVQNLHVVHCGVRPDVFRAAEQGPRGAAFNVLCVASLERHKGHRHLLEACAELQRSGVDLECVLVGDGPDRGSLEELADQLGLGGRVWFAGRQPTNRVVEFLQHADVVTLQSVMLPSGMSEGIPVSLMEAMSAERPVVASRLRGIPELVEHERTGLLVTPGDSSELAAALRRIHDQPQFAGRIAAAARDKVLREFNLSESATRLNELFTECSAASAMRSAA
jgi:colanic acid/amylovoran biosynthesis glycosyltransferase